MHRRACETWLTADGCPRLHSDAGVIFESNFEPDCLPVKLQRGHGSSTSTPMPPPPILQRHPYSSTLSLFVLPCVRTPILPFLPPEGMGTAKKTRITVSHYFLPQSALRVEGKRWTWSTAHRLLFENDYAIDASERIRIGSSLAHGFVFFVSASCAAVGSSVQTENFYW